MTVSVLYVILAVAVVLSLLAGQMLALRYKWMEYASASLQARAMRPHVFARTLLACVPSTVYVILCCKVFPAHPQPHWSIICLLCCVPAVIFYLSVPVPPVRMISTFGPRASRVIWSIFFGIALPFVVLLVLECFDVYSSGVFL